MQINHIDLGNRPFIRSHNLYRLIAAGKIKLGGNKKLKIYGTLKCGSGRRMKLENRVFFKNEEEALANGYRPCGNCMPADYKLCKKNNGTI
ncbi:Ada metal-binding domain-containing protein [Mucilaginibacter calamicampi]|uniref:Ada metal-binding domain-containing protein n=1 Tax=Mucilaginibacter calamicampi TaxID=1302352 RepID=A0ABW2YZK4_9SPHI